MNRRQYLQIPGPTNIPQSILDAMSHAPINHRGAAFENLLKNNIKGLQEVFQTENDILIFPSSGSGCLEATIVNLFSPGDFVIGVNMGVFSKRFGQIAETFGLNVIWINVVWGQALMPDQLLSVLEQDYDHKIKAVLLTHSETSTGVLNNIALLRAAIDAVSHPALLCVDAVSSLAITNLPTDDLRLDVVIAGSQKGLMLPGGLGIVSVSEKAWFLNSKATLPRWYWDFAQLKERIAQGRMTYTPAIAHFFGLQESLRLIKEEGLANVFIRHHQNACAVQNGLQAAGISLLVAHPESRADSVTAAYLPAGISDEALIAELKRLGVSIGGGLQKLNGQIFRVGHLGMLHELEVLAVLGGLEMALQKLGYKFELGSVVRAAMRTYLI